MESVTNGTISDSYQILCSRSENIYIYRKILEFGHMDVQIVTKNTFNDSSAIITIIKNNFSYNPNI